MPPSIRPGVLRPGMLTIHRPTDRGVTVFVAPPELKVSMRAPLGLANT
jgi:hypothetical protein